MESFSAGETGRVGRHGGGNAAAVASLCFGILGLTAVGVIAAAMGGALELDSLSDEVGYGLYGAVPSLGFLGLVFGLIGRRDYRLRWMAWTGLVLGSLLVLLALVVVIALLNAARTLG